MRDTINESALYLFFDTETTGVPRNYHAPLSDSANWPRLVQLAWIITDKMGNEKFLRNFIIKPEGFTIPSAASAIHGITTQRALREGEDLKGVLHFFLQDLNRVDYVVGHNVEFDKCIVGAEFFRLGYPNGLIDKKSYCTMRLSTRYCRLPNLYGYNDYKWPRLEELHYKLFGRGFPDAHNAFNDIKATIKCFWEMRRLGLIQPEF